MSTVWGYPVDSLPVLLLPDTATHADTYPDINLGNVIMSVRSTRYLETT